MKTYLTLLLALVATLSYGQKELSSIAFTPERNASDALIIKSTGAAPQLLVTNKKEIQRFKYNNELTLAARQDFEAPKSKYSLLAGYEIQQDGTVHLYYSNTRKNKFCMVTLPVEGKKSRIEELDFRLKKETYLHAISHNNKFYILSIDFKSVLKLSEFDAGKETTTEYPLAKIEFEKSRDGSRNYLHQVVKTGGSNAVGTSLVELVDGQSPNSIETASKNNKLYVDNNIMRLVVDRDKERTQVIEISLTNKSLDLKTFEQPMDLMDTSSRIDSNSYLYDDKLFQVLVSKQQLALTVRDYNTGELLKTIELFKDQDITIANSPIIQEGGDFESYRELEKTSQLLRKMTAATPGVPVYEKNGIYEITLGGSQEIATGGPMMAGGFGFGGAIGGIIVAATINPTFGAYNSYTRTKSTYFISLFDQEFNHVAGQVVPNVFDQIRDYTEDKNATIETLERYQGNFIYGYYDKNENQYKLVQFDN